MTKLCYFSILSTIAVWRNVAFFVNALSSSGYVSFSFNVRVSTAYNILKETQVLHTAVFILLPNSSLLQSVYNFPAGKLASFICVQFSSEQFLLMVITQPRRTVHSITHATPCCYLVVVGIGV